MRDRSATTLENLPQGDGSLAIPEVARGHERPHGDHAAENAGPALRTAG